MIYRLVTLAEAKRQIVYDDNLSDAAILFRLDAASRAIMGYIEKGAAALDGWTDSNGDPLVDENGDPQIVDYTTDTNGDPVLDSNGNYVGGRSIIPAEVAWSTIVASATMDEDRKADIISPAVRSLLVRFRDPTVA